ncbi:MAG: tRNA(fMet)-specific endonuclease VapC [Hyphomicrobiales bacterium]|nr:tRNA(fMet)-specific endonuclease VapC [Hyphomicrobiales bacterium]
MTDVRFLLDTNTCIYIRRRRPTEVIKRFERLRAGEAALSIITYGELAYGCERGPTPLVARKSLQELMQSIPVIALPVEAGPVYGSIRLVLAARGELIGSNDLWIAAHAVAANLTLVTNNQKEFRRVRGLRLENWVG